MTYIFARNRSKRTAILRAAHTYKAIHDPLAVQQVVYTIKLDNHERQELTGAQLHANWRQVQPTPRRPRNGNRYTSTRGARRREQLGRRP